MGRTVSHMFTYVEDVIGINSNNLIINDEVLMQSEPKYCECI